MSLHEPGLLCQAGYTVADGLQHWTCKCNTYTRRYGPDSALMSLLGPAVMAQTTHLMCSALTPLATEPTPIASLSLSWYSATCIWSIPGCHTPSETLGPAGKNSPWHRTCCDDSRNGMSTTMSSGRQHHPTWWGTVGLQLLGRHPLQKEAVPLATGRKALTLAHRELYLSMTAFTCASWLFCMSATLFRSFRLCSVQPLSL